MSIRRDHDSSRCPAVVDVKPAEQARELDRLLARQRAPRCRCTMRDGQRIRHALALLAPGTLLSCDLAAAALWYAHAWGAR
jgi:hypothetical protein